MSAMEFAVLGELRVRDGDLDRTPRGQRSRDLLAALLLRSGQAVEAGTLLDLVWGEEAVDRSPAVVHTQMSRLRSALGDGVVETTGTGYRLVAADTDAAAFETALARAREHRDPDLALGHLEPALALWRGTDSYVDISRHLVEAETTRLGEARADALELRAELLLRSAREHALHEALAQAETLVAQAPLRERGHELAMIASWRLGRQGEALAGYDRLRRLLRDELGVDPGPAVRELHGRMLDHDPTLGEAGRAAQPASAPPRPVTATIGREEELARLVALADSRPLVTMTGPGGVGKSRLLAELHAARPDRARAYVDLASLDITDPESFAEAVARAVGVRPGPGSALDAIAEALRDADLLLLLDEAERDVAAVGTVAGALVRACPGVSVVVASRTPLTVTGEVVLPIAPLPCPPSDAGAATVAASPAVRLLRDRIADHAPGLGLDHRLDLVADLARKVDGLPLALELLAGHARTRSLAELGDLLTDPLALAAVEEDRPDRHRSLRDVVAWSYERLPADQAQALRRLAVFAGPFSVAAACVVVGGADAETVIRALARDGLVHLDRAEDGIVLRLLRTVRDLALAELEANPVELRRARDRHRRWHADRWRGALRSDALLFDVRDHYSDYVAALADALENRDGSSVGALAITLARLWSYTDMLTTGMRWTDRAIDSGLLDDTVIARVRTMQATLYFHNDPGRARAALTDAITVLTRAEDAPWLVTAHLVAGLERADAGDPEGAVRHGRLAVEQARRVTDERLADALGALACSAVLLDPDEAEAAAREAWSLALRSGSMAAISSVSSNVSWALISLGRPQDARDVLREAMAERTRIVRGVATLQDPDAVPTFLRLNLAWSDLLSGDPGAALAGFAFVLEATPDSYEDRRAAEIFLGAGAALADLEAPTAAEVISGAEVLVDRSALVLMPWQEKLLARAAESAGGRERWAFRPELVTGHRLADLVREAAPAFSAP